MTNSVFEIKRGDLAPIFRARCIDASDPTNGVDLTSATTIKLLLMNNANVLVVNGTMTKEDQTQSATKGFVRYAWQTGDTSTAGVFRAEVEVTWSDGKKQTYPRDSYARVIIYEDLG